MKTDDNNSDNAYDETEKTIFGILVILITKKWP